MASEMMIRVCFFSFFSFLFSVKRSYWGTFAHSAHLSLFVRALRAPRVSVGRDARVCDYTFIWRDRYEPLRVGSKVRQLLRK